MDRDLDRDLYRDLDRDMERNLDMELDTGQGLDPFIRTGTRLGSEVKESNMDRMGDTLGHAQKMGVLPGRVIFVLSKATRN